MNKLLKEAVAKVQALPPEMQEKAARILLMYAGEGEPVYKLTPDELADLAEAEAEYRRGDIASGEEVRAVWAKHGL